MYSSVRELVEIENNQDEKNTYLKARVKNYLVLIDILNTPEVVEKHLTEAMKNIEKRVS
jgi:hypothetical protein